MQVRRILFGLILVVLLTVYHGPSATFAQSAVPTPTADGCDDIPQYIEDLDAMQDQVRTQWQETFPGETYPGDMSDEEGDAYIMGATPEQFEGFSEILTFRAELLSEIEAPPIAAYYQDQEVQSIRIGANLARDASTMGIFVASIAYSDTIETLENNQTTYAGLALAICPEFAQVLEKFGNEDQAKGASASSAATVVSSDNAFELSGTTSGIIDPFPIADGKYRVSFMCEAGSYASLSIEPLDEDIASGYVYISIGSDDPNPLEKILDVRSGGEFVGEVDCNGNWTVTGSILG